MPVTWKYYTQRRRIDPKDFIAKYNCKNYDELCTLLNHHDVLPPTEEELKGCWPPAPRKKPPQAKQSLGTKTAAKSMSKSEIRKKASTRKGVKKPAPVKTEKKSG